MKRKGLHLSDGELIMAADGELPSGRMSEVEAHLAACWSCRERSGTLQRTIAAFMRERKLEFDRQIPSQGGPQALLRTRLGEASHTSIAGVRRLRPIRQAAPTALACICGLMALVLLLTVKVNAEGPRPKASLTAGETRSVTLDEVCRSPAAEVVSVNIPEDGRRRVFSEYGIERHPANFEVDYLITPDLGGASWIRNLWPQPYSTRWNAHVKDMPAQRPHDLVCEKKSNLPTAQREIASDWIGAYKKYFRADRPPD